jgi:hypothetical protein
LPGAEVVLVAVDGIKRGSQDFLLATLLVYLLFFNLTISPSVSFPAFSAMKFKTAKTVLAFPAIFITVISTSFVDFLDFLYFQRLSHLVGVVREVTIEAIVTDTVRNLGAVFCTEGWFVTQYSFTPGASDYQNYPSFFDILTPFGLAVQLLINVQPFLGTSNDL